MKTYELEHSDKGVSRLLLSLSNDLFNTVPVSRGEWQAQDVPLKTHELANVIVEYSPTLSHKLEQQILMPDLPWAEDHFKERVSGIPHNPPPSHEWWPWHLGKQNLHLNGNSQFSHTYPERYWPTQAGYSLMEKTHLEPKNLHRRGIRFAYGDLFDVVSLLKRRPFTRQAYFPVWFPEDTGATEHQRVPCSLGYHFIRNGPKLDCNYFLRSCDITRHFKNDIYFTVRLMQWITERVQTIDDTLGWPQIGKMMMFISNLHMFADDAWRFNVQVQSSRQDDRNQGNGHRSEV